MTNVAVPRHTPGKNDHVSAAHDGREGPDSRRRRVVNGSMTSISAAAKQLPRSRQGRGRVWIAAGLALMALSGCTGPGESNSSLPSDPSTAPVETLVLTSTPTTSTVAAADKAEQDALAAYRAMWQDFVAAGRTSDWQSPDLGRHATGIALQNMSRGLYTDHQNGVVTGGEPILNPAVSSAEPAINPTKVKVTDCGDSTNFLKYDAKTGQPTDDEPGGRQLINATVELQSDHSWKVSDFGVHEVGSCG